MTYPSLSDNKLTQPYLITDELRQWAAEHYRTRTFFREEKIPTRSGLLYFINSGFVRLESTLQVNRNEDLATESSTTIIAFLGKDQPIDVFENNQIVLQAIAQTDRTEVFWVYWSDLDRWTNLRKIVLQNLQSQHQKQLILRSILSQKKSLTQLMLYLDFLASLYGEITPEGKKIPFILTHEHLASVLGTTRVTVGRLLGQLKDEGKVSLLSDQYFQVLTSQF